MAEEQTTATAPATSAPTKEFKLYNPSEEKATKENPIVKAGVYGGIGVLAYFAWTFNSRPTHSSISLRLIHTRLAVQSTVVGFIAAAMFYDMYKVSQKKKEAKATGEARIDYYTNLWNENRSPDDHKTKANIFGSTQKERKLREAE